MPGKRTITLQAAIRAGRWELVAKYASQHGQFRGTKSALILPGLKAFVVAMALPGEALIEPVLGYLGLELMNLV